MPDKELFRLSPVERIKCYRNLAVDARRVARSIIYLRRQRVLLLFAELCDVLARNLESQETGQQGRASGIEADRSAHRLSMAT